MVLVLVLVLVWAEGLCIRESGFHDCKGNRLWIWKR